MGKGDTVTNIYISIGFICQMKLPPTVIELISTQPIENRAEIFQYF